MLNGIDPVLIFQFRKKQDPNFIGPQPESILAKIPLVSSIPTFVDEPPIPIYLSQQLTGIQIDSEDKNVDLTTDTETKSDGTDPSVEQKGLASTVTINLIAKKNSVMMTVLSAMADRAYEKASSDEYAISWIHGPTTIFRGKITSWAVNQNRDADLMTAKLEITLGEKNPQKKSDIPQTPRLTDAEVL